MGISRTHFKKKDVKVQPLRHEGTKKMIEYFRINVNHRNLIRFLCHTSNSHIFNGPIYCNIMIINAILQSSIENIQSFLQGDLLCAKLILDPTR